MIRENRASSKINLDVQKCYVPVAKHIVVMISILKSTSLAAKDSTKEHWKTVAMVDQCQSIAKCWRNFVNVTSTNRGFRTIQHSVATYEQTKKGLSFFYPKRIVEEYGIHTKPLYLSVLLTVLIVFPF